MPNDEPHQNPFAAPIADDSTWAGPGVGTEAEQIREQHINHEASLKTIGLLHYLAAFFTGIGTISIFAAGLSGADFETDIASSLAMLAVLVAMSVGYFVIGRGLRGLRGWVRPWATITSILSLLSIPIGTMLGLYTLYLLWGSKAKMVFSAEYQEIIAQTPHVKRKTSIIVWIFLGLLLFVLALGFGAILFGA